MLRPLLQIMCLGLVPIAIACQASPPLDPAAPSSPASDTATRPDPTPVATTLSPGQYCYAMEDDTLAAVLRLTVAEDQTVSGDSRATVSNEAEGYYTAYAQQITGTLAGDVLTAQVRTWIEYDVQDTEESWQVTATTATTDQTTLAVADCASVRSRYTNAAGLEAADLLADATAVQTERVEFAAGASSTVINQSVLAGERHVYLVRAEGGQQLDLTLTAVEQNAVFDVVSPSGDILTATPTAEPATNAAQVESILLPHTGDYQIIIGSTRGNATYELQIAIP